MAHDQQKTQKGQALPNMDDHQAREYVERMRWPNGPWCPHCASVNVYRMEGKTIRDGLLACRDCRGHFTVTVGTVMEDSHLPLSTWVRAFHLIASSKKGISALQLQRNLGLGSYRTAWHLAHRVRGAVRCEPVAAKLKGEVQVDETYVGPSRKSKRKTDSGDARKRGRGTVKQPVVLPVETDGNAHSQPVASVDTQTLRETMEQHIDASATIVTDEWPAYRKAVAGFSGGHKTVNHGEGEYSRFDGFNTNTAEAYFSLFKRGVHGTFHHISKKHMHRYCDEFSFRWNGRKMEDTSRRDLAVKGAEGKRLFLYQPAGRA